MCMLRFIVRLKICRMEREFSSRSLARARSGVTWLCTRSGNTTDRSRWIGSGPAYKCPLSKLTIARSAPEVRNLVLQRALVAPTLTRLTPPARCARRSIKECTWRRLDLNHPPTAVGGILKRVRFRSVANGLKSFFCYCFRCSPLHSDLRSLFRYSP